MFTTMTVVAESPKQVKKTLNVSVDLQAKASKLAGILKTVTTEKVTRLFNRNLNDNKKLQDFLNATQDEMRKKIPSCFRKNLVAKKLADLLEPAKGEHIGLIRVDAQRKLLAVLTAELVEVDVQNLTAWLGTFNLDAEAQEKAAKQIATQKAVWLEMIAQTAEYRKVYGEE